MAQAIKTLLREKQELLSTTFKTKAANVLTMLGRQGISRRGIDLFILEYCNLNTRRVTFFFNFWLSVYSQVRFVDR